MSEQSIYCSKCGFPTEYCEYSSVCKGTKKSTQEKPTSKIIVTTKKVSGNKIVTIVRNLNAHLGQKEIKEISRSCSKTIACGSSIIKSENGTEYLSIQTSDDLRVIDILTKNGVLKEKIERLTK
ncbi:translation initiation factor 1 [Nematocida sp. LUAm3]|nr:translation initiation factor 1 [Nematocida sp. LUAm3]KAI5175502.1 translation initiation factor 1 [Nematocida sp. LUAm2]KAI5178468.1 translation initiation factor 1 [Nematocida sp. LUAm1]